MVKNIQSSLACLISEPAASLAELSDYLANTTWQSRDILASIVKSDRQVVRRTTILSLAAVLSVCVTQFADAQSAGINKADKGKPAEDTSISLPGEIIVTANKRSQTTQEVSASISAVSGADIEAFRVKNVEDLRYLEPGLQVTTFNSDEQYIGIRGSYTNNDAPGAAQGVAVFVDDVATTGPDDLTEDYFDLDHIEILRGPQGTLFGRNVTGGVVSIFTAKPSYTPEFRAAATYGNYNQREFQSLITGPLIDDRIAGKLTLDVLSHDGFIYNSTLHNRAGGINHIAGRGQLRFDLRENLRLIVGGGLFHDSSQGFDHGIVGTGQPVSAPFNNPTGNPIVLAYGPWTTNGGYNGYTHRNNANAFAKLDWRLGFGTLTAISGYRSVRSSALGNAGSDPSNVIFLAGRDQDTQFTQEVRLASPDKRRLSWIVGTYYINSDKYRLQSPRIQYSGDQLTPSFFGYAPVANAFAEGGFQVQQVTFNSISGFGEVGYDIVSTLNLTVGARYTNEHKSGTAVQSGGIYYAPVLRADGGCSNPPTCDPTPQSHSWGAFTPKATLTLKPSDNFHVYFTVARGFKGGGFDYVGLTPDALMKPYKPEYATNYELGLKTELFDRKLSIAAAVYREDYTDLQVRQNFFVGPLLNSEATNVGKARVQGLELDAVFRPTRGAQLGVNYAYTDFRYQDYILFNGTGDTSGKYFKCVDAACNTVDLSGHQAANTPRNAVTVFGQIDLPLGGARGHVAVYGDVAFRSVTWSDAFNDDAPFVRKLSAVNGLINANLAWTSESGRWKALVWAKNLNNVKNLSIIGNTTGLFGLFYGLGPNDSIYQVQWNEPRTFGLTLSVDFK